MKIRRYSNLVAYIAVSFAASVIFSFAAAQTADIENTVPAAGATSDAAADAPADPVESAIADSPAEENPAAAAGATSDPVADVSAESVESVIVDSLAVQSPAAAGDSAEVVLLPEPVQPVKPRYNRDDVLWIQQRLEELGYYTGPVDGAFGRVTREAIKAYQTDQEIEQDGRPTAELREFMWRNGG